MNKFVLSTAAIAMALGLATATTTASAKDRYPQMMMAADMNKDGMVSKEEFLQTMAKAYDEKMAKMKAMTAAAQAKMMKGDQMTMDGYRALLGDLGFSRH
jgi:6-phosphogluconate dehydrogenase